MIPESVRSAVKGPWFSRKSFADHRFRCRHDHVFIRLHMVRFFTDPYEGEGEPLSWGWIRHPPCFFQEQFPTKKLSPSPKNALQLSKNRLIRYNHNT